MYYVLSKTKNNNENWNEQAFRSGKNARTEVKNQLALGNNVKLCVGKGRDRRDLLHL